MKRAVGLLCALSFALVACTDGPTSLAGAPQLHDVDPLSGDPVVLTGVGTPVLDGALSPGEWAAAGAITVQANLPASEGGGTTPVTLYVMNDDQHLYLALELHRAPVGAISTGFNFDNDHDGAGYGEGDDGFVVNVDQDSPTGADFADNFWTTQGPCSPGAVCGPGDIDHGGTDDGAAAGSWDATHTYLEISHPLDSDDDAHDFSLAAGDVVGVTLSIRFIAPLSNWPDDFGDTDYPFGWGDIVIAAASPEARLESLLDDVRALSDLNGNVVRSLVSKLENVIAKLDKGNVNAAINQLQAFINQVQALMQSGHLAEADGEPLIDLAQQVIDTLGA